MAKPEWGAKRICHNCGTRYYDLLRDPIVCPRCQTEFDPEAFLRSRRSRSAIVEEIAPARGRGKVAAAAAEDEEELGGLEEAEEAAEETETTEAAAEEEEADLEPAPDLEQISEEEGEYSEDEAETDKDIIEDAGDLGGDEEQIVDLDESGKDEER